MSSLKKNGSRVTPELSNIRETIRETSEGIRKAKTLRRDLWVGDLVITDGPELSQVISVDRDAVIVAPMLDLYRYEDQDTSLRYGMQKTDCTLVPPPLIPLAVESRRIGRRDYWGEFDVLIELLRSHTPPDHPVRFKFEMTDEEMSPDDRNNDDTSRLERCVHLFYSMPLEEQTRILNGWTPIGIRPSAEHLEPGAGDHNVRHAVNVIPSCRDGALTWHSWEVDGTTHAATLTIFENTTKVEAMKQIQSLLRYVDQNWETMIKGSPSR